MNARYYSQLLERFGIVEWSAQGGYAQLGKNRGQENRHRERVWFSPHCLNPQPSLFDE